LPDSNDLTRSTGSWRGRLSARARDTPGSVVLTTDGDGSATRITRRAGAMPIANRKDAISGVRIRGRSSVLRPAHHCCGQQVTSLLFLDRNRVFEFTSDNM
jgi:hypothetical protein